MVGHGDVFPALGLREELDVRERHLALHCVIGDASRLGTGPDDKKGVRCLNRILRLTDSGLLYEADPRHVDPWLNHLAYGQTSTYLWL